MRGDEPKRKPLSFVKCYAASPKTAIPETPSVERSPLSFVKASASSATGATVASALLGESASERLRRELEAEREQLRREHEAALAAARERLRREHEATLAAERKRLRKEREEAERKRAEAELEAERERLRKEREAELSAERERLRKEREAELSAERERLRKERDAELEAKRADDAKFWAFLNLRTNAQAGTFRTLTIKDVRYNFRYCPPGTFQMGSPKSEKERGNDETRREVTLTRGFLILETPVTQRMWTSIMGTNPSRFKIGFGDRLLGRDLPAENVSWNDCQDFIKRLNDGDWAPVGFEFRLPWEAEWEYACRAGTTTPFFWGSTLNGDNANCNGNYPYGNVLKGRNLEKTSTVWRYSANAWGLFDMHGNVWEWCADWYGKYAAEAWADPTGPTTGSYRVLRGGSWNDGARLCRSAARFNDEPANRLFCYGLRLVLGLKL